MSHVYWYIPQTRNSLSTRTCAFIISKHGIITLTIYCYSCPDPSSGIDSASNSNEYLESSWGKGGRQEHKPDNFTAICEAIV
jgi:hypothetical protein